VDVWFSKKSACGIALAGFNVDFLKERANGSLLASAHLYFQVRLKRLKEVIHTMPKSQDLKTTAQQIAIEDYGEVLTGVTELLEMARRTAARATNALMTVTYWEIGRRIVECEQGGKGRAAYGQTLLVRLSNDLKARFGRGFGVDNLELFRAFYMAYPEAHSALMQERNSESSIRILPGTLDMKQNSESLFRKFSRSQISEIFPLPWTHYARLIRRTRSPEARAFYESEALRGGWTITR